MNEQDYPFSEPLAFCRNGRCRDFFARMPDERILRFFREQGVERIRQRSSGLLSVMLRDGMETAFLQRLFEAAGGKKNKQEFRELFENTVLKYPQDLFREHYEALIWGESGFLPSAECSVQDPVSFEKVQSLWKEWSLLRPGNSPRILWTRSAVLPFGSPERKIGYLCAFIRKNSLQSVSAMMEILMRPVPEKEKIEELLHFLAVRDPFWEQRTGFTGHPMPKKNSLVSRKRLSALLADAVIPVLTCAAKIRNDETLARQVLNLASEIPAPEPNSITRKALNFWFPDPERIPGLLKDGAAFQGVLHFWSERCEKSSENCSLCRIEPEKVFGNPEEPA